MHYHPFLSLLCRGEGLVPPHQASLRFLIYIYLDQYCCSTSDAKHNSPKVLLKMYIITSSKSPTAPSASQSLQQSPYDSHRVQPDLVLMPFSPTILHLHSVTDTPSCSLPAPASKTLQRGAEKWFNESEHWLYIH